MKVPFVDLYQQYLNLKPELDDAIESVIKNSDFIRGSHMVPFEKEFANAIGVEHCISCANGTDALYIALKALGVGVGDEVITTAHTWISSSETISQAGANVVFCDTEQHTFNIDSSLIEEKITPQTKGIVVVHLCGQAADVDKIRALANKFGLWIIEDCAQAHLATLNGRKVGTFGDVATFSFYPGKNLGAMGDAGCIVTRSERLADWMTLYSRHGGKGNHEIEGINSRMDGLHAAVLRVKLPHLPSWNLARRRAAALYDDLLQSVNEVEVPVVDSDREHVYHLYMIKIDNRDLIKAKLSEKGVQTSINYEKALPFYKAYDYLGHLPSDFPVAHANQSRILSLPIYPEISTSQQEYVVDSLREAISECKKS